MRLHTLFFASVFAILFLMTTGCVRRFPDNVPPMEVNLFVGIEQVARLGDTEAQVLSHTQWKSGKSTPPSELTSIGFVNVLEFGDLGTKVYLRSNGTAQSRVALIETQEPFKGTISGKKVTLFSFGAPAGNSWEDELKRQFGSPLFKASGGRLGSEALFYRWGDIAYNNSGLNQLALYKDEDIRESYRRKSFGRVVKFME